MEAEKISGEVGIEGNLTCMLHKLHNLYYEFVIHTKAVKSVSNGFRNVFKTYIVSLIISKIKPCNGIFASWNGVCFHVLLAHEIFPFLSALCIAFLLRSL